MSLMIKGMNMPKSCKDCPCREYPKFSFESNWCCLNQKTISDVGVISPNCPLIEVPTPHGRLIDADELFCKIDGIKGWDYGDESDMAISAAEALSAIDDSPTIIEAEVNEK